MILHVPGRGPLTEEESSRLFFLLLDDDTEDAPWMVMSTLQFAAASDLFQSLRDYAERQHLIWSVAGMTPILYTWPGVPRKRQLAPDVFVAFVPDRPRSSFDVDVEGGFPPFVLEVVAPSSAERDRTEKRDAYELLGAQEYALFTPSADRPSDLAGYRRNAAGRFEPWPRDEQGRLWSEVLELYLVAQGTTIRAATRAGELLPTLREAVEARERERREAEAEIARLRQEIERLRGQAPPRSNGS
jgi:Uma2 family endonuclease